MLTNEDSIIMEHEANRPFPITPPKNCGPVNAKYEFPASIS